MNVKLKRGDIVEYVGNMTLTLKGAFGVVTGLRVEDTLDAADVAWIVVAPDPIERKRAYAKNLRKVGEICE